MKKIYLLLFLVLSSVLCAQDKFYVYHKDGVIDFFLCDEVDSITYSQMDISGIVHEDFVSQQIHFSDTTIIIPLASIDSVSFREPEIIFKENVVHIEDVLLPYVIRVDNDYLLLDKNIPSKFIPEVDEILLFGKKTTLFPNGFAGKTVKVNEDVDGWHLVYTIPELDEIYEQFFYAERFSLDDKDLEILDDEGNRVSKSLLMKDLELNHKWEIEYNNVNASFGVNLTFYVVNSLSKDLKFFSFRVDHTYDYIIQAKLEGKVWEKEFRKKLIHLSKPIEGSGCLLANKIYLDAFLKCEGAVALDATVNYQQKYSSGFHISEEHGFIRLNEKNTQSKFSIPIVSINMQGSVYAGVLLAYGIGALVDKSDPVGVKISAGINAGADFALGSLNKDPLNFYANNKDKALDLSFDGILECSAPEWMLKYFPDEDKTIKYSLSHPIHSWHFLPNFTSPHVIVDEEIGTADIQSTVSGDLLLPTKVGVAVCKAEDGFLTAPTYCYGGVYDKEFHNPLKASIQGLQKDLVYKTRPYINFLGLNIIGNQETSFSIEDDSDPIPADLIGTWEYHVVYSDGGFEHLVYQFNKDGTFIWKDMNRDGTVDDITEGTYTYNPDTHILILTADGETGSFDVKLTEESLFILMNYGEGEVWDEYKKKI